MFSAFFGNYLLNKKAVTPKQLKEALALQDKIHVKLGTLAIGAGYMSIEEVEDVHSRQLTTDQRFGEIALEQNYLTASELDALLNNQQPRHMSLGQALVDLEVMSMLSFKRHLNNYKKNEALNDETIEHMCHCNAEALVDNFIAFDDTERNQFYKQYMTVFIKNMVRFINRNIHFGEPTPILKNSYDHLIYQNIHSETTYFTALAGDEKELTAFAGIYADEQFKCFGEYPIDAIGEYMNQTNGLFIVNQDDGGMPLRMDLHNHIDAPTLKPYKPLYDIPISCCNGRVHLILGQL